MCAAKKGIQAGKITFAPFCSLQTSHNRFADYLWVEAIFISGLFALVGVAALLFPFALRSESDEPTALQRVTGVLLGLSGLAFLLFGAFNYYTHIGLIVNTMPN